MSPGGSLAINQTGIDIVRVTCEFVAAWNARDDAARRRHLERSWSGAGCFVDPTTRRSGLQDLLAYIGECRDTAPDARYAVLSIDAHHRQARVAWTLRDPKRGELLSGHSVGEFDAAGRLRSLVTIHELRIEGSATV